MTDKQLASMLTTYAAWLADAKHRADEDDTGERYTLLAAQVEAVIYVMRLAAKVLSGDGLYFNT
jgi:hypothetical protein